LKAFRGPIVTLLVLVGAGATLVGCNKDRAEGIKLLNDGVRAEELGDREIAYALYVRANGIDPTNHRALFQMALIEMFDRKQPDKAIEHLLEAEKIEPNDRDVLYQLGRYYATLDKPDSAKAVAYLDRALAEDPNYAPAMYHKGVMLAATDDAKGADKAYRDALAMDPKYTPAWRDLGELYERYDQQAVAGQVYERGLEYADDLTDLYNNLGMLRMQEEKPKDAIVMFDKAVQQGGDRTDIIFNLAFAFVASDDVKSAFRYLGEYINRSGSNDAENVKVAHLLRNAMLEEIQKERTEKMRAEDEANTPAPPPEKVPEEAPKSP
jgi:Tfp pilus assembly protein PilF